MLPEYYILVFSWHLTNSIFNDDTFSVFPIIVYIIKIALGHMPCVLPKYNMPQVQGTHYTCLGLLPLQLHFYLGSYSVNM